MIKKEQADRMVGVRVRAIRNGMDPVPTLDHMESVMGVAASHISKLERGQAGWTIHYLIGAAKALGVHPSTLTNEVYRQAGVSELPLPADHIGESELRTVSDATTSSSAPETTKQPFTQPPSNDLDLVEQTLVDAYRSGGLKQVIQYAAMRLP